LYYNWESNPRPVAYQSWLLTSLQLRQYNWHIQCWYEVMFKKYVGKQIFLRIPPHLKSRDSRIPGFSILFKNSNSGHLPDHFLTENQAVLLLVCFRFSPAALKLFSLSDPSKSVQHYWHRYSLFPFGWLNVMVCPVSSGGGSSSRSYSSEACITLSAL
jgi:hypothetical protein